MQALGDSSEGTLRLCCRTIWVFQAVEEGDIAMLNICHFSLSPARRVHSPLLTVLVGQLGPREGDSVGCHSLTGITLFYPYARYEVWWEQIATRSVWYCGVPLCWTGGREDVPLVTEKQANKQGAGKEGSNCQSFRDKKLEYQHNCPGLCSSGYLTVHCRTKSNGQCTNHQESFIIWRRGAWISLP